MSIRRADTTQDLNYYGYSEWRGWCNISYNFNGFPGSMPSDYRDYYTLGEITYLTKPKSSTSISGTVIYTFKGWSIDGKTVSYVGQYDTKDITVKALWDKKDLNDKPTFPPINPPIDGPYTNCLSNSPSSAPREVLDEIPNENLTASITYIIGDETVTSANSDSPEVISGTATTNENGNKFSETTQKGSTHGKTDDV